MYSGCFYENEECNMKEDKCELFSGNDEGKQKLCEHENNGISKGIYIFLFFPSSFLPFSFFFLFFNFVSFYFISFYFISFYFILFYLV
jgi:hypothetical protein